MEKIQWDESFSVGVAQIDEQHKGIINMINLLLAEPEPDVRSETVSETLTRMTKYAREHFETEEGLLAKHGYPELTSHKEEHLAFRKRAADLCFDTMGGRTSVPEDVLNFLREWFTQHILTTDMRYRPFFKERGIK